MQGPRKLAGKLPNPPSNNGRFQNLPLPPDLNFPEQPMPGPKPQPKEPLAPPDPTYYADTAVIAFRVPDAELRMADLHPKVTSSAKILDAAALMDGDVAINVELPYTEDGTPLMGPVRICAAISCASLHHRCGDGQHLRRSSDSGW